MPPTQTHTHTHTHTPSHHIHSHTLTHSVFRDTAYRNSSQFYQLAARDQSFFIVCGLNHVKTGKATYINFAVRSVLAVDDSKFEGSARKYAPNLPNVDMFCKCNIIIVLVRSDTGR